MKTIKFLFFSVVCMMALNLNAQEYVDLGLPSGILWKTENETNPTDDQGFYTYDTAVEMFDNQLPTEEQFRELMNECTWMWNDSRKGYDVQGTNGNSIFLPAAGFRSCDGDVGDVEEVGLYWSSTPNGSNYEHVWCLVFLSEQKSMRNFDHDRCSGLSVRLVLGQ